MCLNSLIRALGNRVTVEKDEEIRLLKEGQAHWIEKYNRLAIEASKCKNDLGREQKALTSCNIKIDALANEVESYKEDMQAWTTWTNLTIQQRINKLMTGLQKSPYNWYQIEKIASDHFKAPGVSVVPMGIAEHNDWFGPIMIQIVKHPGYVIRNRDIQYRGFETFADAKMACESLWTHLLPYLVDTFDCEDFAGLTRNLLILFYGANGTAEIETEWHDTNLNEGKAHAFIGGFIPGGQSWKYDPIPGTFMGWDERRDPEYKTENIRLYVR